MNREITPSELKSLLGDATQEPRPSYAAWGSNYFDLLKGETAFHINLICRHARDSDIAILDVGAFLGHTSIALKKLGFLQVHAVDVPENSTDPALVERFRQSGIPLGIYKAGEQPIPYPDDFFDLLVFTEVLEHLTTNPFDVMDELRRVLKPGGRLLIATPNQCWLHQRIKMLLGRSYWSLREFEAEREPGNDLKYGHHWHEYTMADLKYLLVRSGFLIIKAGYVNYPQSAWGKDLEHKNYLLVRKSYHLMVRIASALVPSLRWNLYAVGEKNSGDFRATARRVK